MPDPTLTDLADAAFRRATAQVIRKAQQTGTPIILWECDELRIIRPEDALDRLTDVAELLDLREARSQEASSAPIPLSEVKDSLGLGQ
ncbi:MAG: hypothetical protein NVSMB9_36710 [Isosphaeraceae bacterium]